MRRELLLILVTLTDIPQACGLAAAGPPAFPAKIFRTQYLGWDVLRLTNGLIALSVAPQLGGRAIQLELGGESLFYVNKQLAGKVLPAELNNQEKGWANYGGDKVWPAPQGWTRDDEWPGPPDYVLDGSIFQADIVTETSSEVSVRVTSPPDPRTGVQFSRTFHVCAGSTKIKVEQVMRNVSRRRIRWGIWHVTQHDAADLQDPSKPNPQLRAYVPLSSQSRLLDGYRVVFGDARHPAYQLLDGGRRLEIRYLYQVGKVAVDSDQGWLAVVNLQKRTCFVEFFTHFQHKDYPDYASVEFWLHGPGRISLGPREMVLPADPSTTPYLLESEVLSPFAELDPGEEYRFAVHWGVVRATGAVRDAVWAGVVNEPLSAFVREGRVALRGCWGVFAPGAAEAIFFDSSGTLKGSVALQKVDPREVFRLDKEIPLPSKSFRVSVLVRDEDGENRGFLGGALLTHEP